MTGLVGRILADLPTDHRPPKALAVAFRQGMGQTLMAYEKRMAAVQVMEQTLTDAQIPYLTVKGACTAAAYPDPSLRTCGDTDIVLTQEHLREAVRTLEQRGFAKKVTHDDVVMLTLHGFEFELHTQLESINDGSRACWRTLLRRKWHAINPKISGCCNRYMPFITPCCTCCTTSKPAVPACVCC